MKLENDPSFTTQCSPHNSYNPFDSDDEHTDDFIKSYANAYNLKSFEKNVDPLAFHLEDDNMSWEEAILVHTPKSAPIMSNDSEFTDKTIINGEKENSYHDVKDIGVDEGIPLQDKMWVKSKDNQGSANPFETGYLAEIDELDHDLSKKECGCESQGTGNKSKLGVTARATRDHGQPCTMDELDNVEVVKNGNGDSKEHDVDDVLLEHVKESSTKLEAAMESREYKLLTQEDEATTPESSELPVQQASSTGIDDVSNTLSEKSKAESGNIIFDFNSSINFGKEEEKGDLQNNGNAKVAIPKTILRHENETIGLDKRVHGETSFSSTMPPPASITYMGVNARCGSTSLRSESSTGSTRSFAFPVLQTEWNSSPVKMAKPDPRHRQKHRGWVQSLICCKF